MTFPNRWLVWRSDSPHNVEFVAAIFRAYLVAWENYIVAVTWMVSGSTLFRWLKATQHGGCNTGNPETFAGGLRAKLFLKKYDA